MKLRENRVKLKHKYFPADEYYQARHYVCLFYWCDDRKYATAPIILYHTSDLTQAYTSMLRSLGDILIQYNEI